MPYTIEPRKGWPAINFFFNTAFDAHNQYVVDEPWSRPGDYVLLRATTDLVCLSSACPDDIDPANAWNPTEVHVRVYPAKERFSAAIAHRVTPGRGAEADEGDRLPREDLGADEPLHRVQRLLAADLVRQPRRRRRVLGLPREGGRDGPLAAAEVRDPRARRRGAAAGDDDARHPPARRRPGRLHGDVQRDRRHARRRHRLPASRPDNFRFVGGAEYDGVWLREQAERLGLRVWVKESTDDLHNIARAGAGLARDPARSIVWTPPAQTPFAELKWFRFSVGRLGGPQGLPLIASRTGYSGELGYELFCHPKDAPALWDAVMEAGRAARARAARPRRARHAADRGGADLRRLRVRRPGRPVRGRHRLHGHGRQGGRLRRPRGARSSAARTRSGVLVGLELEGNETAGHGDCVHVGRSQVGVVTSGTRSPILKKNIALCRMAVQYAELGTEVEVGKLDGHQKRIPATVVRFPFYDPEKRARARDRRVLGGAGRGVRPRRLPDRRGGPRLAARARPAARALRAALPGRLRDGDQARRGELGAGPRPRGPHAADLQRLAGRHRDRGAGALRAHRPARRAARPLPRHADPAGQRALEAAGDEGDRLPPGLVVRRLPRAGRRCSPAGSRSTRRPPTPARSSTSAARTCGRSRRRSARSSTRPRTGSRRRAAAAPGGRGARRRPGRRQAGRRLVPPRPHVARLGAEHERERGADGARHAHAARSRRASTRRTST